MKYSAVIAAAAFGVATSAQSIGDIPGCALAPLLGALGASGCEGVDVNALKCACVQESFVASAHKTILEACKEPDATTAIQVAVGLCAKAGVEITVPGSEPTSSPVPTPTPTPTPAPSSTAAEESSTTESSSTPAPIVSTSSSVTIQTSTKTSTTLAPVPTGGNNTNNGTGPTTPIESPGGAGRLVSGGVFAAALGAVVVLFM